jgi:heme exporter protein B
VSRTELVRAGAVAWKDLTAEKRTRVNFNAVVSFAGLMLLLFGFALGPDAEALRTAAAGIVWLTILFSGVLVFNRSFQVEFESGAMEALLMYPGEWRSIFIGKVVANLAFVFLVQALILPMAVIFYRLPPEGLLALIPVLVLGTVGFVTLGTFYAAMASRVRAREVLLPLLLFPMLIPLLVAAVQATTSALAGDPMGELSSWIRLLVAFDVVFVTACVLAFEQVVE